MIEHRHGWVFRCTIAFYITYVNEGNTYSPFIKCEKSTCEYASSIFIFQIITYLGRKNMNNSY